VNVAGRSMPSSSGAPVVLFSTDYVFDGRKAEPYVESDAPSPLSVTPHEAAGRGRPPEKSLDSATSWLYGWTNRNFVRIHARLGAERDEVAVVDDQRGSPPTSGTSRGGRELLDLPRGLWHRGRRRLHVAELAEAIFEDAGIDCRVRRISSGWSSTAPHPGPSYSVLRSERPDAPTLPHCARAARLPRAAVCLRRSAGRRGRALARARANAFPVEPSSTRRLSDGLTA